MKIGDVDTVRAIFAAVHLHGNNYRMSKGQTVAEGSKSRTVASLLLEMSVGNQRIGGAGSTLEELVEQGAKVGPYFMMGANSEPLYRPGVGLWLPKPIVTYEA